MTESDAYEINRAIVAAASVAHRRGEPLTVVEVGSDALMRPIGDRLEHVRQSLPDLATGIAYHGNVVADAFLDPAVGAHLVILAGCPCLTHALLAWTHHAEAIVNGGQVLVMNTAVRAQGQPCGEHDGLAVIGARLAMKLLGLIEPDGRRRDWRVIAMADEIGRDGRGGVLAAERT